MRKFFYSLFISLLFSLSALAQTEGISFQGLARNAAGEVLVSQKISLRLSILLDSESGTVAYTETRQVTTNPQGIFSLVVGDDKALTKSTNFSAINWTPAPKFIKVEMDPNGGTSFVAMGTSRLQAVPFAFHAYGVDAANVKGVLSVASGGTGATSISDLKTSLGLDQVNNSALDSKVDKVAGKGLSTNDYTTAEKTKLAAITGTNTGDQDLSSFATTAQLATKANATDVTTSLATKVDKVSGKELSTNDYTTAEKTKLAAITGTNTGDQDLSGYATTAQLANKVDKVTGKELSTNDYTTAEKTKLAAITGTNTGDQVNITGNAGTATKLQTSRTINGIAFDGSADITLPTPTAGIPYTGATQAVDLGAFDLKVNGLTVGRGNNGSIEHNVGFGKDVLRSVTTSPGYLTAVGHEALYSNTTGYNNTAIGSAALKANTGGLANTAIGSNSLQSNTTANFVTAVGNHALRNNTDKGNHTAVGSGALEFNSTGELNSAFGYDALKRNTSGSRNTATGVNALVENTTGGDNTATGYNSLKSNTVGRLNTAIGSESLNSNIGGIQNTAVGSNSLEKNVGVSYNTAVGAEALRFTVDGESNTATGASALRANISGAFNSAFGRNALVLSTANFNNAAFGAETLSKNVANNNTAFGAYALQVNTSGQSNTAVGIGAMKFHTTGNDNVAVGVNAGLFQSNTTTGSNNTAIGAFAEYGSGNLTNATVIGSGATVSASNSIRLGNSSVTVIGGQVAWTAASDSRIKKNIVNSTYGLATVLKLRPVEYNLTSNDLKQVGFIAQEVQKLVPEVVTGKEGDLSKGEILGITYSNLVPVLTKAIQEQQKQIEVQNAKIAAQQKQIEELIKLVKGQ